MAAGVRAERTKQAVERVCASAMDADDLLEGLLAELHRVVPHDAAMCFGVDPVTMLATAPSRVENLDAGYCDTFWHLEFHEQDVALFADLARDEGATAMRLSLDDRIGRSVRYREFMRPQGYGDELRGVLSAGERPWGALALYRETARPAFDDDDVAVVRAISGVVAAALRTFVRETNPWLGQPCAPGLVVMDGSGHAISANGEALSWLRELWPVSAGPLGAGADARADDVVGCGDCSTALPVTTPLDLFALRDGRLQVPSALHALVARARAVADGRERTPARLRLRDRRGRWVVLHASALSGPGSPSDAVAVVIEAAKSAEIAPIIIDAYSLTPREREVLGAIARGGSTAEIATELFLSPHTVRDYVKTVFEKFGVSSRSELVARLYGEHYADRFHDTMVHVH